MRTTWTEINGKLDSFLGDAERVGAEGTPKSRLFPIPLRIEAWNWSQRILVHHTPMQQSQTLVIDEGNRSAILPSDLYQVHRIYDADAEKWMRPMRWNPNDVRYVDDDLPEFWVWGNQLFLEKSVRYDAQSLTLFYWAHYPEIDYITDEGGGITLRSEEILVPGWAELPLCHLVTAFCMNPKEIESSDLNQYKIRVESGTPVHNPRAESITFHIDMWNRFMDMFPPAEVG